MKEINLSFEDKKNLKADIKLSFIIVSVFFIALLIIVGLIPLVMYLVGKSPASGFISRSLFVFGLLFIPVIVISWKNILKYIDLKKDKKFSFETSNYQIEKKKDSIILQIHEPYKIKFEIYLDINLKLSEVIRIEFVPASKTLLFISNSSINLLEI